MGAIFIKQKRMRHKKKLLKTNHTKTGVGTGKAIEVFE